MNGATRNGVSQSQSIRLEIQYYDTSNNFVDPSTSPTVSIVDPTNMIVLNVGGHHTHFPGQFHNIYNEEHHHHGKVMRQDVGLYYYDYMVPINARLGVWQDIWSVSVNGTAFNTVLNFTVSTQTSPVVAQAGQEIDPQLSQEAITNVLLLMKLLRTRLGSDGVRRKRDAFGAYILDSNGAYVMEPCNVFSTDELYRFLVASLAEFNSIPHFTNFTFDDPSFVKMFQHELTEGAFILAMALQGLREKGREFQMTDDGLSYQPPMLADYIKSYLTDFMTSYRERIKFIKCNMKPTPRAFGTIYSLAGAGISPSYLRLRHLRERSLI